MQQSQKKAPKRPRTINNLKRSCNREQLSLLASLMVGLIAADAVKGFKEKRDYTSSLLQRTLRGVVFGRFWVVTISSYGRLTHTSSGPFCNRKCIQLCTLQAPGQGGRLTPARVVLS